MRKEIADWKKRFKFYLNKRVALEKELDKEFRKELHHFYSVENEIKQEELKKLKKLLKKHNEDDTRETTEFSTYLTKLFPTKNYTEYTKEETLRLEAYNARLTDEEKIEIKRDKKFVEQIGQLQFFPGKTEIKHRKNGETYTVKEPAYFKGRVFMHGTWITQKHHYNEVWAAQNFHPTFLAFVKSCKGKWLKIPPGDPSDEKAPKYLRSKVRNAHRQLKNSTCCISGFACALAYIATKENHSYVNEAALILAGRAADFEGKSFKEQLGFIDDTMKKIVPGIGQYIKFNVHRAKRKRSPLLKSTLIEVLTPYPTLVMPIGEDGSKSHVVTVVDDLIFDSTQKYALKLTQQSLDWICGECGCSEIGEAVRFCTEINKKHRFKFGSEHRENWK